MGYAVSYYESTGRGKLSGEKIEKLERIGIYLSATDKWTSAYSLMRWSFIKGRFLAALDDCRGYYAKHRNLQLPLNMVGKSGVRLNY